MGNSVIERLPDPAYEWLFESSHALENFQDFSVGNDGSLYVSGETDKSMDSQSYNGSWDGYLVKYNPSGEWQWTRIFGSSSFDSAYNVEASQDGSIYVAGLTSGGLGSQTARGKNDLFISKYSSAGASVWTRVIGSSSDEYIDSMVVGNDGTIFVTGGTLGSFNGQVSKGGSDAYVVRINKDGQTQWTKFLGTSQYDEARDLVLGPNGSVYVCGDTYGNFDSYSNNGASDVFLSKIGSSGVVEWSKILGSSSNEYVNAISIDKLGNIYVGGETSGSLDGQNNKGNTDAFVAKYSSDGVKQWTRLLGSTHYEYADSIAVDGEGSVFVAGYTNGGFKGELGYDGFLGKFTPDGDLVWEGLLGASSYGTSQRILAASDAIYIGGNTSDSYFYGSKYNLDSDGGSGYVESIVGNNFFTEGVILTAGSVTADPDGVSSNPNYKYQWLLNGASIPGATHQLFTTNIFNGAGSYSVQVTYTDAKGFKATVNSAVQVVEETPITSSTTFSSAPKEGAGVFTTSINLSAGTQTTVNHAEGAQVWWKVTGITAEDLVSGALTGTGNITNGKLDIQHSLKVDADSGEKFEFFVYSDASMTSEYQIGAMSSVVIAENIVIRGNSIYTIVDGPSWTQAEANSVKLGGHLATIDDSSEEDSLFKTFGAQLPAYASTSSPAGALWIGLTDNAVEGSYKWVSGDTSDWFESKYKGKGGWIQNSDSSQQDYIILRRNGSVSSGYDFDDYWVSNSSWSGTSVTAGIAETPFIRRGDSAYVIVQGPTWEEAEANAVKLGGHLVTINDAAENEWLHTIYNISNGFNNTALYLTGYTDKDKEGDWKWISGDQSSYVNWDQYGPSNNDNGNAENFMHLGWFSDKQWNDIPSSWRHSNYTLGIAEIKLAPNNAPTGFPLLSGTTKVGQVITIDGNPIQDADNLAGYPVPYNYSWEVSTNGTTWTKLTSTDATDNNTTFILTTAEVGKQVRGVVSYLDGYGTNESIASAGSTNVIAPSNTAPTAVQTLTGSSKVGRVLTADKSTIVDPDGVPTAVSYGWEVSTNGTTWTKLTSADATDNNSTYALTAADLGKTIRSVISYTDGLGTNEMVSSAPTSVVLAGAKPTGISLSKSTFAENVGPNTAVAKLSSVDLDTDDAYTYTLVTGPGSTDNSRFSIAGDQLVITGNPDFETKNSYSIRLRTTDLGGLSVDKSFTLKVTNVNEAPIAISLSDSDFLENIAAGSVIANLGSIDPDRDTAFTYSLTPNSPRATFADNQFFSIVNDQLKINASANFEQKDSYTISVRSTDAGKLFYDQVFTLVVQDVDEAPTDISITGTGIDEGAAVGSIVGSLVSADQDESSTDFTFELLAGNKPNNNDLFEIVGDQLKAKSTFNFETKSSYVVNVRTTDEAGLTFNKSITIRVNNVNENPTDLTVSATAFNENLAIGTTVSTLGVLDPDKGDTYSYSFVSGEGDKDNQAFLIAGNALKVNVATNFEVQKSYAVRLRVTDQGGLFFDKAVSLGVNNQVEKVTSGVSTTLAPDKDTLELTGTRNVFGMGNQFDNTITGNAGRNKLTGGMGKDILTGGAGVDTFVYNDLKESLLSGFDVITDYGAGEKVIAGFNFEGDDLIASTGKASAFTEGAIGSVLSNTIFLANNAVAFTVEGLRGTFLALNDARDGFQADSDALIHLSNYTIGSKTPISII